MTLSSDALRLLKGTFLRMDYIEVDPSGSPISVLHWPPSCDLCRYMPSAGQDLEQHEDIIPSGCYGGSHVELSIQNTVKRRMLLLTCILTLYHRLQNNGPIIRIIIITE